VFPAEVGLSDEFQKQISVVPGTELPGSEHSGRCSEPAKVGSVKSAIQRLTQGCISCEDKIIIRYGRVEFVNGACPLNSHITVLRRNSKKFGKEMETHCR
jgi:hypothetical protein